MKFAFFFFVMLFSMTPARASLAEPLRNLEASIRIKKVSMETPRKGEEIVCEFHGPVALFDYRLELDSGKFRPVRESCVSYVGKKLKKNAVEIRIFVEPSLVKESNGQEIKRINVKALVALVAPPGNYFFLNVLMESVDLDVANLRASTNLGLQGSDMPKNLEWWTLEARIDDPAH